MNNNLHNDIDNKYNKVKELNKCLKENLSKYEKVQINSNKYSIPHILNISIMDVMPESMIHALDSHEIYVSTNTACSSGDISSSILAIYDDQKRAKHTIRISLSHVTTTDEVNKFLDIFKDEYEKLGSLK